MKKLSTITRNIGRCTELRLEWQEKLATSVYLQKPNWQLSSGINGVRPKIQKVLQFLCLHHIFNGTFVKLNKALHNMLRIVEPYIGWGYPNLKSVNELMYKCGYGKRKKNKLP